MAHRGGRARHCWSLGVALACLLTASCRTSALPRAYPARGTVLGHDGSPLPGGSIRFHHLVDTRPTVAGVIEKDGRFSLRTIQDGKHQPGAPEGEYRVTIVPPSGPQQSARTITLARTYTISPRDNEIQIKLERPTLRR